MKRFLVLTALGLFLAAHGAVAFMTVRPHRLSLIAPAAVAERPNREGEITKKMAAASGFFCAILLVLMASVPEASAVVPGARGPRGPVKVDPSCEC